MPMPILHVMDGDISDDVAKFKYRASAFCQCFANYFCAELDHYIKTISEGRKDKNPDNDMVRALGWILGGGVGVATGGIGELITVGAAASGGGKIGSFCLDYLYKKFYYLKKAETVACFVDQGTSQQLEYFDAESQRRLLLHVLVGAALHICKMYEYAIMKIAEENVLRSMRKLSYDAACRAVSYIFKHSSKDQTFSASFLIKAVVLGTSKKSTFAKVSRSYFGQEGYTVPTSIGCDWNTAKLFGNTAVDAGNTAVDATNCVYVKGSLDKSMGVRLPADLTDFEPCGPELERSLKENGFNKHNWTMEKAYAKVASDKLITEIGEQAAQRFEKKDLELRFDNIDRLLSDLKIRFSETNAVVSTSVPTRQISFKPIDEPHAAFIGRVDYINAAIEYLSSILLQSNVASVQIQFSCWVICALGGYGKTQTAKKIVSNCKKDRKFQHFIWIDSENDIRIRKSFLAAIEQVGLVPFDTENIQKWVHKFYDLLIERKNERFLMIFDNVEDFDEVLRYLPLNYPTSNIAVLMTSQRQSQIKESYGHIENQPLDLIAPAEGIQLVEKILGQSPLDSDKEKNLLVERSGRIPLLLHLMAASIKFERKYVKDYRIEKYLEHPQEPIQYSDKSNRLDLGCKKSLKDIVRFPISKLNSIAGPIGQIAVKVFDRIAYLSPDGNSIRYLAETYHQDIAKENVEVDLPMKANGLRIIQMAVELLAELCLVKVSNNFFSVHRLVQACRRLDLKDSGKEESVLNDIMFNMPNVMETEIRDIQNILSIWHYASDGDYVDLIKKFYPAKGTLVEFTFCSMDIVKKIIGSFGVARSSENIFTTIKYDYRADHMSPMEAAIMSRHKIAIDLYAQTVLQYKTEYPPQFANWFHQNNQKIGVLIYTSILYILDQYVNALNVDAISRSTDSAAVPTLQDELFNKLLGSDTDIAAAIRDNKAFGHHWLSIIRENSRPRDFVSSCNRYVERTESILLALQKLDPNIDSDKKASKLMGLLQECINH